MSKIHPKIIGPDTEAQGRVQFKRCSRETQANKGLFDGDDA